MVSLKGTGLVDRMLVNAGDEFELRHYRDGYLRYAWFAENYDGDGIPVFDLENWSYGGKDTQSRFRGNLIIYLNKYDPKTQSWAPLSECPFSFWDYNHDGHGDVVLRVSAAPLRSLAGPDADYANNYDYMWAPQATPLPDTGNVNVRFSFNIDPQPRKDPLDKPHYNFGFTMVGAAPYDYPIRACATPIRGAARRRPWCAFPGTMECPWAEPIPRKKQLSPGTKAGRRGAGKASSGFTSGSISQTPAGPINAGTCAANTPTGLPRSGVSIIRPRTSAITC